MNNHIRVTLTWLFLAAALVLVLVNVATVWSKPPQAPSGAVSSEESEGFDRRIRALEELAKAPAAPETAGLQAADFVLTLERLGARIKALEARPAQFSQPGADSDLPESPTPAIAALTPQGTGSAFSDEQLDTFRRLYEAVERRRQGQLGSDRLKSVLERTGLHLTGEQAQAVVDLQLKYMQKLRELLPASMSGGNPDRQAIQSQMEGLKTEFTTELSKVMPASDAERIAQELSPPRPPAFPR